MLPLQNAINLDALTRINYYISDVRYPRRYPIPKYSHAIQGYGFFISSSSASDPKESESLGGRHPVTLEWRGKFLSTFLIDERKIEINNAERRDSSKKRARLHKTEWGCALGALLEPPRGRSVRVRAGGAAR